MKKYIYILLFCSICMSCAKDKNEKKEDVNSLIYIKIEKPNFASLQPLYLSDFADSIEYIQLETSTQCILPPNVGTFLTNDFIFIESDNKLYQFDHKGKFIRQIGSEGQGPGEYKLHLCGFDDKNQFILVESYTNKGPLIFDYSGKFLRNVNDSLINSCVGGIEHFGVGNGFFIYTIQPMDINHQWAGKPYELITYDYFKNNIINTLTNRFICKVENEKQYNSIKPSLQTLTKCDSMFYYQSFYNDTLYSVSNCNIRPFAVIDFGKNKCSNSEWIYSKNQNTILDLFVGKMRIFDVFVYNNNVFLSIILYKADSKVESFLCNYDMTTEKLTYHSATIINDIDGCQNVNISGLNTELMTVRNPENLEGRVRELIYSTLDKTKLKHPEQREKLEYMLKENKEKDDNPILMILHMKQGK